MIINGRRYPNRLFGLVVSTLAEGLLPGEDAGTRALRLLRAAYVRMHLPPDGLGYGRRTLQQWADRVIDWRRRGLDLFVYFNNDMEGHAINDAKTLISLVAVK